MPIDRTHPSFSASTDATGTTIVADDRLYHLDLFIPAAGGCATASFERREFTAQTPPAPTRDHRTPGNRNRPRKKCGSCGKGAATSAPAVVVLRGWRARLHRLAGRERACAGCDLAQRHLGLDWCGSPKNIWRRLIGRLTDGCGCILNIKRRLGRAECPRGLWVSD